MHSRVMQCGRHQRLVRGSENHGKHVGEMGHAKQNCVRGCLIGSAHTAMVDRDNLLPLRAIHKAVLTKDEKRDVIQGAIEVCDTLKKECSAQCRAACGGGKKNLDCNKACVSGCKYFVDFLKDNY